MRKQAREESFRKNLLERCSDIEHEIWSKWMKFMLSKCAENEDGSVTIPKESVERWKRQISTPYKDLSESEKESDRIQARLFIKECGGKS